MILRGYQQDAVNAVYEFLRTRDDNPCIVLPTASGKTPCLATICRDAVQRWGGRVLILAHVRELLEQASEKLHLVAPDLPVGVYSAGLKRRDLGYAVTIAGIQSVYEKAGDVGAVDLVIVDEAHLIPPDGEGMYRQFLADMRVINPHVRVIGFTATPFRMKSGTICAPDNILNAICYEIGVRELIVQGYLCPLRTRAGTQKPDTDQLHVRGGEYVASEVEELMDDENLVRSACREIVEHTRERHSVLIFAAGVRHGQHVAEILRTRHNVECGFVCGETLPFERDETLRRFRSGELKYLCNVNVLTTGFDAPNIDCVALLRPTLSPGLFYQMCLDMDTEVLTPHGWARCERVQDGDQVGAFDLTTGHIEWCPAEEKIHRPLAPAERMYAVSARHLDVRVTHLHTMIYRGRAASCKHWQQRTAESLSQLRDSYFIPVAGAGNGLGVSLSDDELRFLGWALTDGYRNPHNNAVVISQSSCSPWLGAIRATLQGCGFGYAFPADEALWARYAELWREGMRADRGAGEATEFYRANREAMDAGAVIAWPERHHPDELSAIQHAMNLRLDRGDAAFWAEYQNEPLPEEQVDDELLTVDEIIAKLNGQRRGEVPLAATHLTMFVDVQAKALFWLVAAWENDFTGYVLDYGTEPDQKADYFTLRDIRRTLAAAAPRAGIEGAIYAGLERLAEAKLGREWQRDDGSTVRIDRCLIDANWGQSSDVVYQFCRQSRFASVLLPSHGRYVGASSIPFSEYKRKRGDRVGLNWRVPVTTGRRIVRHVVFDTNFWKSFIHARLAVPMGDPGCLSLFGRQSERHRLLADHLTSEYRVKTEGRGRTVDEWKLRVDGLDNHWLDCLVGCAVAASMAGAAPPGLVGDAPRPRRALRLSELRRDRR